MMTHRCSCENESRGAHGPVTDNEGLYRAVLSPEHLRADGSGFKASLFSNSDILRNGVSLIRRENITDDELSTFCQALAAIKASRKWAGGLEFPASVIRSLTDNGGRLMCLFDDPTEASETVPKNDAHALAIASHAEVTEEDVKEIRAELIAVGTYAPST